mmetsp:Transcript_1380/g.3758  ORF Transcript_1380/g.3758 Transcript_1380/m.3758 type:complete len:216 (-) Transcript_1380:16-663(-)
MACPLSGTSVILALGRARARRLLSATESNRRSLPLATRSVGMEICFSCASDSDQLRARCMRCSVGSRGTSVVLIPDRSSGLTTFGSRRAWLTRTRHNTRLAAGYRTLSLGSRNFDSGMTLVAVLSSGIFCSAVAELISTISWMSPGFAFAATHRAMSAPKDSATRQSPSLGMSSFSVCKTSAYSFTVSGHPRRKSLVCTTLYTAWMPLRLARPSS